MDILNLKLIDPEYCMVEWYETYTSVTTDNNVRGVTASGLTQTKKSESRLCTGNIIMYVLYLMVKQ